MKAIILAEHAELGISDLTDRIPHPLLPMAGKTLLLHALEALYRSNIRQVDVVAPALHERLEVEADTTPLRGMDVKFLPETRSMERPEQRVLVVGLTHVADVHWEQELNKLGNLVSQCLLPIRLTVNAAPVALFIPPGPAETVGDSWSDIHHINAIPHSIGPQEMLATDEIVSFYDSCLRLLRGKYLYLEPADLECASGYRASHTARLPLPVPHFA